ncbi:hypothetical protein BS50DRAFT_307743 [Corynespora cassiicola Philippines]|uniref:Uncharacterized protein n=1 Tax=Corynespora cassiicola Philippines TaxID=1448308 RepID=A0A2T2NXP1_CORCC|nr:hypothetical protein BS50DRAFT_307743 [Corynespora cassiicola Philippines]
MGGRGDGNGRAACNSVSEPVRRGVQTKPTRPSRLLRRPGSARPLLNRWRAATSAERAMKLLRNGRCTRCVPVLLFGGEGGGGGWQRAEGGGRAAGAPANWRSSAVLAIQLVSLHHTRHPAFNPLDAAGDDEAYDAYHEQRRKRIWCRPPMNQSRSALAQLRGCHALELVSVLCHCRSPWPARPSPPVLYPTASLNNIALCACLERVDSGAHRPSVRALFFSPSPCPPKVP